MSKIACLNKNTLYCSFCGKSQHEVTRLIAGPQVYICDECLMGCGAVVTDCAIMDAFRAFLDRMVWHPGATKYEKTLVLGNLNGFVSHLQRALRAADANTKGG